MLKLSTFQHQKKKMENAKKLNTNLNNSVNRVYFQLMFETHPMITLLLPSGMFMVATALLPANSGSELLNITHIGYDS